MPSIRYAVGNLTYIHYPSSSSASFSYDALNRVSTMVDGVGTTVYTYTAGNQLLTEDAYGSALLTVQTEDWHFLGCVLYCFLELFPTLKAAGDESGLGRQICWEAANHFGPSTRSAIATSPGPPPSLPNVIPPVTLFSPRG